MITTTPLISAGAMVGVTPPATVQMGLLSAFAWAGVPKQMLANVITKVTANLRMQSSIRLY